MWFSFRSTPRYSTLEAEEDELKIGGTSTRYARGRQTVLQVSVCSAIGFLMMLLTIGASITSIVLSRRPAQNVMLVAHGPESMACVQPTVRQEWRTLLPTEKSDYIRAVQCLATKESRLRDNGTLYDDFPYVHKAIARNGMKQLSRQCSAVVTDANGHGI
jgi:hypothetical protein